MRQASRESPSDGRLTLEAVLADLLADGAIARSQLSELERATTPAKRSADVRHPLVVIAEQNWLSASKPPVTLDLEWLTRWLAARAGLPYQRIDPLKIDVGAVTKLFSHAYASRFRILPLAVNGRRVTVATAEPYVREWEHELSRILKLKFERVLANPLTLERYIGEFYAVSRSIDGAARERRGAPIGPVTNLESLVELGRTGEVDADDQHIVRIVDWLLQYAFSSRASDIHLEPRREQGNIRFRIDGVLHLVHQLPTPILNAALSRIKALGRMDVIERRRPQDGRIKTKSPGGREVEIRLSTMPTTFGEKLVMRIFDPEVLIKSLSELGFGERDERLWRRMVSQPHGMVVVTGPTGSGKTTTLYSALKSLARPERNICTIEDPIELVEPEFNQMYVQSNIGLTFAAGVRTLLRQDPDVIMVGEIRDRETADTAVQAALTGHLVLSTLHTNDAPSSVTRLLDLGVAPYLIRAALLGVVAQRLVRTLCPHCRRPMAMAADAWKALTAPLCAARPARVYAAVGCDECRLTGYRGRVGLFEIMPLDEVLRQEIGADTDAARLRAVALEQGMRPLRLAGVEKVRQGVTTAEEVFGVVTGE